ncbi:cell division control protein CDC7 [Acrasis kona]|uniref:non-specific serine/threonine protein kinase n=1 Tax=Acrasis kona TaxID=1008807 RepID=A0AAW2Z1R7_9EUKA
MGISSPHRKDDATYKISHLDNSSANEFQMHAPRTRSRSVNKEPLILDFSEKSRREAAKSISLAEMFPNRTDTRNKPIKFEKDSDITLNYFEIKVELGSIQKQIKTIEEEGEQSRPRRRTWNEGQAAELMLSLEELKKRRRRLKYYRKIMALNLLSWSEYKKEREQYIKNRNDENGVVLTVVQGEDIEIEILRFDEEYRRVKLRQDTVINAKTLKAIANVDPVAAAENMVDKVMDSLANLDTHRSYDREYEKEKLTEEIARWKSRMAIKPVSQLTRSRSYLSVASDSEEEDFEEEDDEAPSAIDTDLVDGYETDDIEVVILNDVQIPGDTEGFFVTGGMKTPKQAFINDQEEEREMRSAAEYLRKSSFVMPITPDDKRLRDSDRKLSISPKLAPLPKSTRGNISTSNSTNKSSSKGLPRNNTPIDWSKEFKRNKDTMDDSDDVILDDGDDMVNNEDEEAVMMRMDAEKEDMMNSFELDHVEAFSSRVSPGNSPTHKLSEAAVKPPKSPNSVLKPLDLKAPHKKIKQSQCVNQLLQHLKDELEYSEQVKKDKISQHQKKLKGEEDDVESDEEPEIKTFRPYIIERKQSENEIKTVFSPSPRLRRDDDDIDDEERKRRKRLKQLVVELDHVLGTGGHGKVYRGQITDTGEVVAIKKVPVKAGKFSKKFIKLEVDILRQLSHVNLVKYMGCKYSSALKEYSIVLEYVDGGSLEQIIKNQGALTEDQIASVVIQVLKGLMYLHSKKVIHRDLKPGNGQVKITDFGVSAQLLNIESMRSSCVGTPYYSAPEVIQVVPYSYQADIWSLGCAMFEMMFGVRPYHDLNQVAAMYRMVKDGHPPIPQSHNFSQTCVDFLNSCWIVDWKKRPTAQTLLTHKFVEGIDNMKAIAKIFDKR